MISLQSLYKYDIQILKEFDASIVATDDQEYHTENILRILALYWDKFYSGVPEKLWYPYLDSEYSDKFPININTSKSFADFCANVDGVKFGDFFFGEEFIMFKYYYIFVSRNNIDKVVDLMSKYCSTAEEHGIISYALLQGGYLQTNPIKGLKTEKFTPENYNSDLPHDQLLEFLKSDKSGIALLHGKPGTGKSYYIQSLFTELPKKDFTIIDGNLFNAAGQVDFNEFFLQRANSVFILEDCEEVVTNKHGRTQALSTLLNLSDGLLGRCANIKFICTFNTSTASIDTALMRKGRLKCMYEFKDLTTDKVAALFKKFNISETPKSMALCDVYNFYTNTGVKEKRKIGF